MRRCVGNQLQGGGGGGGGGCNYWSKLPRDITVMILQKAGVLQILMSAQFVCTEWRNICTDPSTWSTIRSIRVFGWKSYQTRQHVENLIRQAVDRSCGGLFDLDLDKFGFSNELLLYVVERCTQIRRLRIRRSCLTDNDLERVAAKLRLLEDLEFSDDRLSSKAVETFGRYCPRLSLLKLNTFWNGEVLKAIARSMPQLRHICFSTADFGRDTVDHVEALLDGCPHLEFLDIRRPCHNLTPYFQMMKKLPLTRTDILDVVPSTWSAIRVYNRDGFISEDIIRLAVDTSFGGLVDLDLDDFRSEVMFGYVVARCTQIRRLRSSFCSNKAVRAAVARLPLLEDLELVFSGSLSTETIKTLGKCCPRLTSLKIPISHDECAKTLARSLPQLRRLKPLCAYELTDAGIKALLDGCPYLESLDLLECKQVKLYGTLQIRCAQQIKHLRVSDELLFEIRIREEVERREAERGGKKRSSRKTSGNKRSRKTSYKILKRKMHGN